MPSVIGVDPADPVPGNAHLNDLRRGPAARGPAMITTSFVRSRRQAADGDAGLLTATPGC
jgi:hypothetical protein